MTDDEATIEQEIMTLQQVATYLQLAEKTVLRMAQQGKIPAAKVASQWRFMRPLIRDWLASEMQMVPEIEQTENRPENALMPLDQVVRPELIKVNIRPDAKSRVLRQLLEPLQNTGMLTQTREFLNGLVEREEMMTTGIGGGVAIPHPRHPISDLFSEPAIVIGLCPEGTDYDAVDNQPVRVLFLVCARREDEHLRLMATVGWLVRQEGVVDALIAAKSGDDAMKKLLKLSQKNSTV